MLGGGHDVASAVHRRLTGHVGEVEGLRVPELLEGDRLHARDLRGRQRREPLAASDDMLQPVRGKLAAELLGRGNGNRVRCPLRRTDDWQQRAEMR